MANIKREDIIQILRNHAAPMLGMRTAILTEDEYEAVADDILTLNEY